MVGTDRLHKTLTYLGIYCCNLSKLSGHCVPLINRISLKIMICFPQIFKYRPTWFLNNSGSQEGPLITQKSNKPNTHSGTSMHTHIPW